MMAVPVNEESTRHPITAEPANLRYARRARARHLGALETGIKMES
jgi:hypothetical protein